MLIRCSHATVDLKRPVKPVKVTTCEWDAVSVVKFDLEFKLEFDAFGDSMVSFFTDCNPGVAEM